MKTLALALVALLTSSIASASSNPFAKETQDCIKKEMTKQFPIYSRVTIGEFATVAFNDTNVDYMIFLKNPQTGRLESRSFILIRNDFASASLYFTENSNPTKIDLRNCF